MPTDLTLLTADSDRRRLALALYALRRDAWRIVADCERMLAGLHQPQRAAWREAVGAALVAGRHLLAVVEAPDDARSAEHVTRQLSSLGALVQEPRQRIQDSMSRLLLHFVPVDPQEELLLHDAALIRDTAENLLSFDSVERLQPRERMERPSQRHDSNGDWFARVLVVDDERALRSVLQRHLAGFNCETLQAADGVAALEIARREMPDLVLTDINMPRMDGRTLLKALKADAATRDIPVIVISSLADSTHVAECIEAGAEDHLLKPFEPIVLNARIRATVERKKLRDQERDYRARVNTLTAAAEAVERQRYAPGALDDVSAQDDGLGRLARVFDRMVTGLRTREERLEQRLRQLRVEMTAATRPADADGDNASDGFRSGEILAARYEILNQLGRGGMGMVYRARDLQLNEEVAIKVVARELLAKEPTLLERLKSEIRLARRIAHPNVVRAYDLGEWHGTHFITMEHVSGITVEQLIDRRGRLTIESTLAIGTQLAEALAEAHGQEIIHRDIKPSNLLIDASGVLKVTDFGIARSLAHEEKITLNGFVVGTPHYMPPEQLLGRTVDHRSDLFAAGVVLYECIAGRPPFTGESPLELLASMSDSRYVRLSDIAADVSPELENVIDQQLRFLPADRIASARELATRLAECGHARASLAEAPTSHSLELIELDLDGMGDLARGGDT